MNNIDRRGFLKASAGLAAGLGVGAGFGCATPVGRAPLGRVVVIGGGFGGATAAKYLKKWEPRLDVTLVERNQNFVSCPISNLVLAGVKQIEDIIVAYDGLAKYGVRLVRDEALAIDVDKREVRLAKGDPLPWDRLIVAPGIDFLYEQIPGLDNAEAQQQVLHSWKAGAQTVALRKRLEALPDGGVFAISIPKAPYRCPPGPYERASVIAHYFKQHKPRSKVLILDGNPDITSKKGLFLQAWEERYKGIIEYRANSALLDFDLRGNVAKLEFDNVRADLFNVIPPQRSGRIAEPFANVGVRWAGVDFRTFESTAVPGVHVIGDATAAAPGMPKSGFMANNHAKVAADAVIASLSGLEPNPTPVIANTCYSFVSDRDVVHVASVHKFDTQENTLLPVKGAGGLSAVANDIEGQYALAWARNIWADALA
ncbi:FCSD flavin-binding domain-containing protein [Thauera linaloolentis]|uniref:Flavocytochrome C sulfide dehydrogenase flavin-binding protein n=1 Tax=Thauera linaloolentis (strain DSM 12138 / JCM 21573 / CCUG 41526 / CIP 105981 / IAM 15112 / NBRC 102519 / 47Lol) TaxID=1123367 RepID=N6Y3D3_THAL4|nr:FCSD flavin-binding domain-containing protein [Thauera linaloolentis]ENO86075.1 Flavocytochrome C sulfide dehydrogenase flavin-binding protein [Thauera linaloolentis 47Lol = DSM 12138]MCM8565224.1 FCSD flavin-binding domain-containing protein [Thauera linaloolentis]